jgi:enamine deaminase RidA (YjgF/YER057c/UK114 family)
LEIKPVNPWTWQDNFGFSQAVEVSGHQRVLMCSGQTSVDENANALHEGDVGAQLNQALDNLETVLAKAGMALRNVVRLNIYTTDVEGFMSSSGPAEARLQAAGCKPAMTLLGVAKLFLPQLMVEIEATAVA